MIQKLFNLWHKVSDIGIDPSADVGDAILIRVFNQMTFCIALMYCVLLVQDCVIGLSEAIFVDTFYLFVLGIGILLNFFHYYKVAQLFFLLVHPILSAMTIFYYGDIFNSTYAYFVYIIGAMVWLENKNFQKILLTYVILLWLTMLYHSHLFPPIFSYSPTILDLMITPFSVLLIIILVIPSYKKQLAERELGMKKLLIDVQQQNQELLVANQELERFAFIASHDLKTPLRTIVSFLDIIERKITKGDTQNLTEYIAHARNGGKAMHALVSDVLEFYRMNITREMEVKTFDLNQVLSRNITQLEILIKEKNAKITHSDLHTIESNEMLIGLLFQNLIENGITYNSSAVPEVHVSSQLKDEKLIISIKDNGIGIAKEYQSSIFQLFTRLHDQQTYAGSGMGLAICKKIVEKLKGEISLESEIGVGTTFFIAFPVNLN
jgi:signal transduction histidine kinase